MSLAVTVTDPSHKIVGNLQRNDFAVYEDGVIQDLAYFETGDVPLDLALLIDTSASMEGKLGFVRKAATGFTATLRPGDRASVISFNNRVNVMQPFTEDVGAITRAIGRINANGGTALYNALYITLKEYARDLRKDDVVRRRAIVLLTDGEDTASLMSFDELLREAKREAITVYTIGLRGDTIDAGRPRAASVLADRLPAEVAGQRDRRAGVLPGDAKASCRWRIRRSARSSPSSTRSATYRRTRSATAPTAASRCRSSTGPTAARAPAPAISPTPCAWPASARPRTSGSLPRPAA